jgi:hypothetical protein
MSLQEIGSKKAEKRSVQNSTKKSKKTSVASDILNNKN